jgi:transcriptional regulator
MELKRDLYFYMLVNVKSLQRTLELYQRLQPPRSFQLQDNQSILEFPSRTWRVHQP